MSIRYGLVPLCLALPGVLACSRAPASAAPASNSLLLFRSQGLSAELGCLPGGGSVLTLEGVRIEVGSDVSLELPLSIQVQITSADGRSVLRNHEGSEILLDGDVLELRDGRLWIGDRDHGPVAAGDRVVIDGRGVRVEPPTE